MDNGEVIPGLDEDWTLGGANLLEWMAGFMALIIASEVIIPGKMTKNMPVLMAIWVGVTFGLAMLRKMYPDGQRGLMNRAMVLVGLCPPGLAPPAELQPFWSGFPATELGERCKLRELGIDQAIDYIPEEGESGEAESFIARARSGKGGQQPLSRKKGRSRVKQRGF
jgi:hypothetical protein